MKTLFPTTKQNRCQSKTSKGKRCLKKKVFYSDTYCFSHMPECGICFEKTDQETLLNCCHTVCTSCRKKIIKCPFCRKIDVSGKEYADFLLMDNYISRLSFSSSLTDVSILYNEIVDHQTNLVVWINNRIVKQTLRDDLISALNAKINTLLDLLIINNNYISRYMRMNNV